MTQASRTGNPPPPASSGLPPGLPATATIRRIPLSACDRDPVGDPDRGPGAADGASADEILDVLVVPLVPDAAGAEDIVAETAAIARGWCGSVTSTATPPHGVPVVVPLYGCEVVWTPGRAVVVGPPARLEQLLAAVADFATREAELRRLEHRTIVLLAAVERDAAAECRRGPTNAVDRWTDAAGDYRESVAIARRLAVLAPAVHAPPLHPPTLASQVGERLRERSRLVERHEFAVARAELAERVAEGCSHRAGDARVAGQQTTLEWAIVVLLLVQTVLLVVDLLARERLP